MTSSAAAQKRWAFLDRIDHVAEFEQTVVRGGRILVLSGGAGLGKSALLRRFEEAASAQDTAVAFTSFTDTDPVDTIALMCDIAERVATTTFRP